MDQLIGHLAQGFSVALTLDNLLFCFTGVFVGTLVGVLPGIGPVATIAMLLPLTFNVEPTGALIMLAGIYYGAQYGGSVSAILLKLPGEAGSVVTTLDGHPMAKQGRGGEALAVAAIGSFVAGTFGTLLIAIGGVPLVRVGQAFSAADYFALMLFGLMLAVTLAESSRLRAAAMAGFGVLLGLVGTDVIGGAQRFTFGIPELADGIGFVPIAMGIYALAEIALNLERGVAQERVAHVRRASISRATLRRAFPAILRGTGIGSLLGLLPGGGAVLSSFAAYFAEKRIARDPSRFGHGAIEGVAAPESANNAGAQTSFIPMLTLGIPTNAVMALMVGAMTIQGIQPGPQVMEARPGLYWGMIASMWIGNFMLLIINLPLVGIWVRLLDVPYRFLFPAIALFSAIGVYSIDNSVFDVVATALFGVVGYVLLKLRFDPAPLLLGFILGPFMEEHFRRALLFSRGDYAVFLERPISASFLALGVLAMIVPALFAWRRRRRAAAVAAATP